MAGNTIGTLFRLTTFGESHGKAIGGVLDGCPAGLLIDKSAVDSDLKRRRPGQSPLTTGRKEPDTTQWLSGLYEGKTTGAPITFISENHDIRSQDYEHLEQAFRPSHADYTTWAKYGIRDHRGGGRSSARETWARVAAGAIARQLLSTIGLEVSAYVERVQDVAMKGPISFHHRESVDAHPVRCPDSSVAEAMAQRILEAKTMGDTVGGTIALVARGVPVGLGEPIFDKLQASLARALWSLPAVKSMEIGSGIQGTFMKGSEHNDPWTVNTSGDFTTTSNHSGGIQGGISNGSEIVIRLGFKPVSTLLKPQVSVNQSGEEISLQGRGRHDPCVLPRAVPLVEAMVLLVLADEWLKNKSAQL